jgi:hypothetical protein
MAHELCLAVQLHSPAVRAAVQAALFHHLLCAVLLLLLALALALQLAAAQSSGALLAVAL